MKVVKLKSNFHLSVTLLKTLVVCICCISLTYGENYVGLKLGQQVKHVQSRVQAGLAQMGASDVVGHLDVALDHSHTQHNDVQDRIKLSQDDLAPREKLSLQLCLASLDPDKTWILNDCVDTKMVSQKQFFGESNGQVVAVKKFKQVRFPLFRKTTSTHLVVLATRPHGELAKVSYLSALFAATPKYDVTNRVILTAVESNHKDLVVANVLLGCNPNQYGARCEISCTPPSEQHRCDHVTGELKCAPGRIGKNCEHKIFLSNEEASQFIKHRSKRENSWHHTEEFRSGNIERECEEEICDREEAREAFEDNALTEAFWEVYTDPNHCSPYPCAAANTLRCEDLLGGYTCHCKEGFVGRNCQNEFNPCEDGPCNNGATCGKSGLTSYTCTCVDGYHGSTCDEIIDNCGRSNCGPYGTCQNAVNSFSCLCDAGFTGSRCDEDINECESNPCKNNGTCNNEVAFYTCNCTEEYEGTNCQSRISPCVSSPCLNDGECVLNVEDYSFSCSCTSEFDGSICQHEAGSPCASEPCTNEGTCVMDRNNEAPSVSTNETTSVVQSFGLLQFTCICPIGYRGKTCEEIITPCELELDDLCPFNSTCIGLDKQYICLCPDGYMGDQCNIQGNNTGALERLSCQENPCLNEARCLFHGNKTICVCRGGYNGSRCETEVDFCESSPCINNGECVLAPHGFYCNCAQGYQGRYCEEDIDECSQSSSLCHNDASCSNTYGSFQCVCGPYNTGRFCENPFDPCDLVPCANGGSCLHVNSESGYLCNCLAGYGGNDCNDIIDPCTDVTNPCLNDASCSANPELTSEAICACSKDFYGRTCAKRVDNCTVPSNITININGEMVPQLVERNDCGANGDCVSIDEGFLCFCHKGFEGDLCQTAYNLPVVNCTSETCICPDYLIDEVLYHEHNVSDLACQYRHYDMGECKKVRCITTSCSSDHEEEHHCSWYSKCLDEFVNGVVGSNQLNSTKLCPVIQVVLDQLKLQEGTTLDEFCNKVRELPSYRRRSGYATVHCDYYKKNDANVSIGIAIDSVTSQVQSIRIALEIFQTLEQEFNRTANTYNTTTTAAPNALTQGLDPIFSAIISLRFGGTAVNGPRSHVIESTPQIIEFTVQTSIPAGTRQAVKESKKKSFKLLYIILPIAVVLLIVLIVAFVWRRRKLRKELQVVYIVNPNVENHNERHDSEQAMMTVSTSNHGTPIKRSKMKEDFVNPLFVETQPSCHALTSRPRVHSNPYVATPYGASTSYSSHSSSPTGSPQRRVEEATIDFGVEKIPRKSRSDQYERMKDLTLPYEEKHKKNIPDEYMFAEDSSPTKPILGKQTSRSRGSSPKKNPQFRPKNPYEEIDSGRNSYFDDNPYETVINTPTTIEEKVDPATSERRNLDSSVPEGKYNFATDVPKVGVSSTFLSSRSTKTEENGEESKSATPQRKVSDPPSLTPSGDDSGIEVVTTRSSSSPTSLDSADIKLNPIYMTPTPLFPKHDTFFPENSSEIPEVYAVPRKAIPEKSKV